MCNIFILNCEWLQKAYCIKVLKFQKTLLEELHKALTLSKHFNLTKQEQHGIQELKKRDDLVIFPTDKNLGPYVISREDYIKQFLNEHLLK